MKCQPRGAQPLCTQHVYHFSGAHGTSLGGRHHLAAPRRSGTCHLRTYLIFSGTACKYESKEYTKCSQIRVLPNTLLAISPHLVRLSPNISAFSCFWPIAHRNANSCLFLGLWSACAVFGMFPVLLSEVASFAFILENWPPNIQKKLHRNRRAATQDNTIPRSAFTR